MDLVTPQPPGRGRQAAARLRRAASDAGIGPAEPLDPVVQGFAEVAEAVSDVPEQIEARVAQLLERAGSGRQPLTRSEMVTIADAMDKVLLHRFARLNRWALGIATGAGLLVGAICGGGGYWLGSRAEADKYVQVPADLGVALTGPSAAQWTNLMRLNDIGKSQRTCAPQAGGVACSISLWTQPPAARGN